MSQRVAVDGINISSFEDSASIISAIEDKKSLQKPMWKASARMETKKPRTGRGYEVVGGVAEVSYAAALRNTSGSDSNLMTGATLEIS